MDKRVRTILLVEDEAVIALKKKMQLENVGYSVAHVLTGEAAVSHALNPHSRSDLVLMDIDLGSGIDGTQAAQQILNEREIPIVFLSSHTESEVVEKTEKITSYGYVVKNSGIMALDASIKMAFKLFDAKQQHAKREEEFRRLFDTMPTGIVQQLADGTITSVNPAAERMLGRDLMDLVGKPSVASTWRMIDEAGNNVPDVEDPVMLAFKTGETIGPVERGVFVSEKGGYVWLKITATPLFNPGEATPYECYASLEDITARKHAEQESNRRNLLLQKIFDYSVDLISITDLRGRIQFVSKSHEVLGYDADDLIGKNAIDNVHPDDRTLPKDIFQRIVEFREQQTGEYRYRMSNGEYRWFETRGILLTSDDGKPEQVLLNTRDITDRKQTDERLRQVLNEYDTVFNGTQDAIFLVDVIDEDTYRSIRTNRAHAEWSGLPMEQIKDKTPQEFLGKELGDEVAANYRRCYQAGHPISYEETLDLPGGKRTWFTTLTPMFDHGEIKHLVGAAHDITDRKQAEDAARENIARFEELATQIPVGIYVLRMSADEPMKFHYVSHRWCEIHKLRGEDVLADAATVNSLVHPEELEAFLERNRIAAREKKPFFWEGRFIVDDGELRFLRIESTPRVLDNGDIRWFGVTQDITDRKHAEEEIHHQLAEKETLLREVHHRIKNNLGQIESLLSIQADSAESTDVQAALNTAMSRVRTTRTLYEKLLVGKGHEKVSMKDYLESLIESLVEVYNDNADVTVEQNVVDFSFSAKKTIPVGIILNELLTNVFKYAFEGRTEGNVSIALERNDQQATLTVQDNGVGFDERVTANKSTGFGLTLVKMLADQLDGTFTMESDNGTKSVVTFEV